MLRSTHLPWVLSLLLIAFASVQSLHEQLEHHGETSVSCEICLVSSNTDDIPAPALLYVPVVKAITDPHLWQQIVTPHYSQVGTNPRAPPR